MGTRRSSLTSPHRIGAAFALLLVALAAVAALGSGSAGGARPGYFAGVRDSIMRGVDRDFARSTGIASLSFQVCFEGKMREALDPPTISGLAAAYRRPGGPAYAAQLLNSIASPLAARCGHRSWVPELTGAARGLARSHATGAGVGRLGITYGPYIGIRCDYHHRHRCEKVGIDLVLRRASTSVTAIAGSQTIHLRTPGLHDGVREHDWVGTFTHAGLLPDRPYELKGEPIYTRLELRVEFADGSSRAATLPHALISPGWG
jgi:hypothetical protein